MLEKCISFSTSSERNVGLSPVSASVRGRGGTNGAAGPLDSDSPAISTSEGGKVSVATPAGAAGALWGGAMVALVYSRAALGEVFGARLRHGLFWPQSGAGAPAGG